MNEWIVKTTNNPKSKPQQKYTLEQGVYMDINSNYQRKVDI